MSALLKTLKLAKSVNNNPAAALVTIRNAAHWNYLFKPGPYPDTEEKRLAAAKKYGLLPEEYKPYPDDGVSMTGDYPQLPNEPVERRDPWYPYDFPEHKRNFQEPIHEDLLIYDETRYGTPAPLLFSHTAMYSMLFGVLGISIGLFYWLEDKKMFRPAFGPQLPANGVHYTFESNS